MRKILNGTLFPSAAALLAYRTTSVSSFVKMYVILLLATMSVFIYLVKPYFVAITTLIWDCVELLWKGSLL